MGLLPAPVPLTLSGSAVADLTGRAEVTLGQVPVGRRWRFTSVTVTAASTALSTATLYRGIGDVPANVLDTTGPAGGNANTTGTIIDIGPGDLMRVVWTDCTPGAACSAVGYVTQYSGTP